MEERSCAEWRGANSLSLFQCHDPQATSSSEASCSRCWTVTDYSMEQIAWNSYTRRLVNQSHGHFMRLQKLAAHEEMESGQPVSAEVLLDVSKCYMSTLHECVQGLRKMVEEEEAMMEDDDYEEDEEESEVCKQASLYAMLELAWHLCQAIFLEALPAGCLIQQLAEWVTWNCTLGMEEMEVEAVMSSPSPDELDKYWPVIYRLVLQGELRQAIDLLQKNSQFHHHSKAFTSIQRLLEKAPMLLPTAGLSRAELRRRWSDWRREAGRRKQAGEFSLVQPLLRLARILSGDEDVYLEKEILESCGDWYELMVGKLLYTCPLVMSTDYELCYTAEWSQREMARFRGEPEQEESASFAMDELLLAALRNDFMGVIQVCSSKTPNWWFATHMANLLYHKGLLTKQRLESASKLCEFLVVEYSCILSTHQSLWQLSLDYLAHCPEQGQHFMQLLIRKIPLTTEKKASKVLQLCKRYQLKESIVADLCKVLAMKCYKNGRIGAALSWCIKGKNSVFAAFLAEKYMESFDSLGEFVDLDLLDHLDGSMLMNKKLLFLAKYRSYHIHCENQEFLEAGQLLSTLLMSESVPERFLPTLLSNVHSLLTKEDVVFDVDQTYALSHFVVQLTLNPPPSISSPSPHSKKSAEDLMPLQQALVNNLSRAIMMQSSS